MHITDDLRRRVAQLLHKGSARYILPKYQKLLDSEIDTKTSDTDFVTIADQEMETFLDIELPKLIADSWVLGEEAVSSNPDMRNHVSTGLVWCVDPVDGTRNFVQQTSAFCAMVSLVQDNVPIASWIYLPLTEICYFTASGKGCWQSAAGTCLDADPKAENWHRLEPHRTERDHPYLIGTATIRGLEGEERRAVGHRLKTFSGRQFIGCAGVEAVQLVTAAHDFLLHTRITPWDHAPVALFAQEAGLYVRDTVSEMAFQADQTAPLLIAPNVDVWHQLRQAIWEG